MRGIRAIRDATPVVAPGPVVDLHVLSAGYGVVSGDRKLAPYETTFAGMKAKELRGWADELGVPQAVRRVLREPYDLALLLLGDSYLKACALDSDLELGGFTLVFCGSLMAKKLPAIERLCAVPVSNPHARRFSCGLIGLKGELACRLLTMLAEQRELPPRLKGGPQEVLDLLDTQAGSVTSRVPPKKSRVPARPNPKVDFVIQIPPAWNDQPHRSKMRYFIPDWDDQVDPDFDFLTETHWGGSGDWSNQTYAHQMFSKPNYDGILVSKFVAEKSRKKKARFNEMGVHRVLRVPRSFPVMGDCGAFSYITEEVPPFKTSETLDYYTRLDFDYGVSIDHLIVKATEARTKFRYELTIENAAEFIREHRSQGLGWTPIGAVQGWDAASYAAAARKYVQMGYRYIALGGLVRTSTKKLLPILQAVRDVVPRSVDIHLFGIARENAIPDLRRFGVNSVDSASVLRKAWLGSDKNYLTEGGWLSAVRIPEVAGSFRAKGLVKRGTISEEDLRVLERTCLDLIRGYASSRAGTPSSELVSKLSEYEVLVVDHPQRVETKVKKLLAKRPAGACPCSTCGGAGAKSCMEVLQRHVSGMSDSVPSELQPILVEYQRLLAKLPATIERSRKDSQSRIRRTLEARPWEACPCPICRDAGVEVLIFRGNNRNRRRGFHNTYVFHKLFRDGVMAAEGSPLTPVQTALFSGASLP